MADELKCRICGGSKQDHLDAGLKIRHAFVGPNDSMRLREAARPSRDDESAMPASQGSVGNALRGDPILRLLLIRKGIISPDELSAVEQELKGAGFAWAESTMGQPRDR